MFDFQKLEVYQKAHLFNECIQPFLKGIKLDKIYKDQLRRAAFSITLNIAEGTARVSKADRRNFYVISRGSAYECQAILDHLKRINLMELREYEQCSNILVEISKMLFSMIKRLGALKQNS